MSGRSPDDTCEDAPRNTRLAALRAMRLHVDKAPRFGTAAWMREESLLYRGARMFRCNVCRLATDETDGGADDMPDACSTCWATAHAVDDSGAKPSPYVESQRHIDAAEQAQMAGDDVSAREHWRKASEYQRAFVNGLRPDQVKTRAVYEKSINVLLLRANGVTS